MGFAIGIGNGLHLRGNINNFLINQYPGAAAAYSLRKLSSSTTSVIRVRRDSDNAEDDFTASAVKNGTLTSWVGAGNGLVTSLYDQSGNNNDAVQATAGSQPKIVDAGTLVTDGGKPAMLFDGTDDSLENISISLDSTAYSTFIVNSFTNVLGDNTVVRARPLGGFGAEEGLAFYEIDGLAKYVNTFIDDGDGNAIGIENLTGNFAPDTQYLMSNVATINSFKAWQNSVDSGTWDSLEAGNTPLNSVLISQIYIGQTGGNSRYFNGHLQEFVLYASDQSANRTAIEDNINKIYNIY